MDETTQQAPADNKKWLWLGLGALVVIILIALLAGWGPALAPGVDVDRNLGSTTYTNEDGSVTVGSSASMPENWPDDAPAPYTGATLLYSGSTNPATGEAGAAVAYNVSASLQSVIEYYTARLRAQGWSIEGNVEAGGMRVITASKDSRVFGAYIADGGNGMISVTSGVQF